MLKTVKLTNFKCYQDKEFDFSNLTVFCGNNSVGKSTAIQALLLILQNDFTTKLQLNGEFVELGTYFDVRNRDAATDSVLIELESDVGLLKWGYIDKAFDRKKEILVEEAPLPSISDASADADEKSLRSRLAAFYLNNFIFLSAERWGPRKNYPYSTQKRSPSWLGIHGEFTPQILSAVNTNNVLEDDDKRIHINAEARTLTANLYAWMSEISPGVFIKSDSIKHANISTNQFQFGNNVYKAVNVGFGLSYVLPVVLSLLMTKPGGLVVIENPEAHLHPRGQSYLGRLIALASEAGIQVIIETHSDHLLNGIRVAACLSETYKGGSSKVYFISSGEEQSEVEELLIDEDGEIPFWPSGFFDQQALDVKSIMLGENITEMPRSRRRERK